MDTLRLHPSITTLYNSSHAVDQTESPFNVKDVYLEPPFWPSTWGSGPSYQGQYGLVGKLKGLLTEPPNPWSDFVLWSSVPSFLRPPCSVGL